MSIERLLSSATCLKEDKCVINSRLQDDRYICMEKEFCVYNTKDYCILSKMLEKKGEY